MKFCNMLHNYPEQFRFFSHIFRLPSYRAEAQRARRKAKEDEFSPRPLRLCASPKFATFGASLVVLCAMLFGGCSTVSTQVAPLAPQEASRERYSILVRTGNPSMDKILREMAVMEFGSVLNINENESQLNQCGRLEITFASSTDGGLLGESSTIGGADAPSTGWYDGDRYWGGTGYASGSSTDMPTGAMLSWQNSTMLITLRDVAGNRLWTADYEYKGGSDISGFWVNTAEGAARVCVKRLKSRMQKDLFRGRK